jgi:hypothetical protein
MKTILKYTIPVILVMSLVGNIYIFLQGMALSDDINRYERNSAKLHQENLDLEENIYAIGSLYNAASLAAQLDFTKQSVPVYINDLKYAYNQ